MNDVIGLIPATAKALGMDPLDLATIISYETAGTFDPTKRGPTTQWGQHRGLIQFGEPQAQQYGVDWGDPIASQLGPDGAIVKYFRDRGYQPGMGLLDAYSIVNAGGPGLYNRTDANNGGAPGTVRDKVESQMADHRAKAARLLGFGDVPPMAVPQPSRPLTYGSTQPDAKPDLRGILADIFGEDNKRDALPIYQPPEAPKILQRPQSQPLPITRRNTLAPYLALFQGMRNG